MNPLYEALLERDADAARSAARAYRKEHSSHDLFLAVGRFAVLAYAPSQHAKHAMLAALAAYELRDDFGERYDDALIECAIYSAASRQPWSEPPIMDPPPVAGDEPLDLSDRLAAERWLAAHYQSDDFASDYFRAAADDFEDLGHKLIVATYAWKLAPLLGEQGRFPTLRTGVWEMSAYHGEPYRERGDALDIETLASRLVNAEGDIESAHAVFLLDAAIECGHEDVLRRVRDYLTTNGAPPSAGVVRETPAEAGAPFTGAPFAGPPIYPLAHDCAATLKAYAVAKRWRARVPSIDVDHFLAAVNDNREHGPRFDDYAFA